MSDLMPLERRVLAYLVDADPVFQPVEDVVLAVGERRPVIYSALSELRKRDLVTADRHGPRPRYACTTLGAAEITVPVRGSRG